LLLDEKPPCTPDFALPNPGCLLVDRCEISADGAVNVSIDIDQLRKSGWVRVNGAVPVTLCNRLVAVLESELGVPANDSSRWNVAGLVQVAEQRPLLVKSRPWRSARTFGGSVCILKLGAGARYRQSAAGRHHAARSVMRLSDVDAKSILRLSRRSKPRVKNWPMSTLSALFDRLNGSCNRLPMGASP
jgi:hypothetical protein